MTAPLRMIPLGVGNAFSVRYYSSCLAVGVDDDWILVDCPHPIRKVLHESSGPAGPGFHPPLDVDCIHGIVVTHLHADHSSGIEGFAYYNHMSGRRTELIASDEALSRIWDHQLSAGMRWHEEEGVVRERSMHKYFTATPLASGKPVACGPFRIEGRRTLHPVPTTAVKITANGRTLAYSADTAFDPELIAWLSVGDMIVHEATTEPDARFHTPLASLASLDEDIRGKMKIIHYPDTLELDKAPIEPLRQGRLYQV